MLLFVIVLALTTSGGSCKIYESLPSYRGYDINCTVCQGTLGDPCDVSPEDIPHTVPCRGSCVVWRTLYNTGRALRTIYRGCENFIFPHLLADNAKNACVYDNFFVGCTTLCEGLQCNQNGTGIPRCWSCHGEYRSCDIESEANCTDPIITTTPRVPWVIDCVSCVGKEGDACDLTPYTIPARVKCNDTCLSWRTISVEDRSTVSVWRGCKDTLFPGVLHEEALDSCDHSNPVHIQCAEQCDSSLCNKYSTGIPNTCWTNEARLKDECRADRQMSDNPFVNDFRFNLSQTGKEGLSNDSDNIWDVYRRKRLKYLFSSACEMRPTIMAMTLAFVLVLNIFCC